MMFREFINNGLQKKKAVIRQVASVLISLFSLPLTESRLRAHDNTEIFWTNTQSKLYPWLQQHAINAQPGVIPKFAQGGSGRAYFLGNYVVKISANKVEATVANLVKNNNDLPTPIIDVLSLGGNFYAILQHFVDMKVPENIRKAADYLTMIVDNYPEMDGYPRSRHDQEKICSEILAKYKGNFNLLPYMLMVLQVLITLYNNTGYKHDDAGPTNIGMHQGKIVIPDLGPNSTIDFDPNKTLEKIRSNRAKLGLPDPDEI